MRQFRRIRTGALAATVVMAGLVTSGAGDSSAADGASLQMQFAAVSVQSIRLNVGPQAPSTGDRLVFSHTLTDTKNKKTTGLAGVECIMTSVTTSKPTGKEKPVTSVRSNCIATIVLTDGQIAAQGLTDLVDNGGSFELAVTGGTGAYTGAAGVMRKAGGKDKGTYIVDITRG
jgi:hypothetical protein